MEKADVKRALDAEPKVTVFVPGDPDVERENQTLDVAINGYMYRLRRGMQVEVPYPVYEVLRRVPELGVV